ncbi:MAG: hypothetical protein KGM49_06935 [Sphingomonadales bacterium]|nr:hypothetical protein [Sphingomonadales bacterium]
MLPDFFRARVNGYMLSMISTCVMAVPVLRNSHGDPVTLAIVAVGVVLALAGVGMRWHSHRIEQRCKADE